jgi:hypothetical protein
VSDPPDQMAGHVRFRVALGVATALRVLAFLTLLGGTAAALFDTGSSTEASGVDVATLAVTTVVSAGVLAFLGYVLEILVAIYDELYIAAED